MAVQATNYDGTKDYEIAEIKDVYHPNLLINGDFQCNQRGQKEYPFGKYGIDMWFANGNKHFWTTDGLVFDNIWQKIPLLKGTNYVLSYKIDKTNVQKNIFIKALNTEYTDGYLKVKLETDGTYTKVRLIKNNLSNPDRINYVQLVEGNVAYPHVKEDSALALERCQQYLISISSGTTASSDWLPLLKPFGGSMYFVTYSPQFAKNRESITVNASPEVFMESTGWKSAQLFNTVKKGNLLYFQLKFADSTNQGKDVYLVRKIQYASCEPL